MFYAIEYDTNKVLFKAEDAGRIHAFKLETEAPFALIDSPDELCLEFTIGDMQKIYGSLVGVNVDYSNDIKASKAVWKELEEQGDFIDDFVIELGEEYLSSLPDNARLCTNKKDNPKESKPKTSKPKTDKPKGVRANALIGMNFCNTSKTPREGVANAIFTNYIEENMGEATFDELVTEFIAKYEPPKSGKAIDETFAKGYIRGAFQAGYIEEAI